VFLTIKEKPIILRSIAEIVLKSLQDPCVPLIGDKDMITTIKEGKLEIVLSDFWRFVIDNADLYGMEIVYGIPKINKSKRIMNS